MRSHLLLAGLCFVLYSGLQAQVQPGRTSLSPRVSIQFPGIPQQQNINPSVTAWQLKLGDSTANFVAMTINFLDESNPDLTVEQLTVALPADSMVRLVLQSMLPSLGPTAVERKRSEKTVNGVRILMLELERQPDDAAGKNFVTMYCLAHEQYGIMIGHTNRLGKADAAKTNAFLQSLKIQ